MQPCGMDAARQEKRPMQATRRQKNRKERINPTEQRWVSEKLVQNCEHAWLDPSQDEYMSEREEWLIEASKEKSPQLKESHEKFGEKLISSGDGGAGFVHKSPSRPCGEEAYRFW